MSDNKKYYYLKLKDNYFDQDNIKVLESLPNGHLYSLIILKLYLKACKYNGHLKMTDSIPYDPEKIGILSNVIGHDRDNVEKALNAAFSLGLITKLESGEMWMTEIQNYIGESSTEGDRKRKYRAMLKGELISTGQMSGQSSDIHPPEIEIEIDKEIEIKKNNRDIASFEYFQLAEIYFNDLKNLINPPCYKKRKPDLVKWSDHIRLLHEQDGIEYKDMRPVWQWAFNIPFWQGNLLSTEKFRKHYNKLSIDFKNNYSKDNKNENKTDVNNDDRFSVGYHEKMRNMANDK